jgi:nitrogen regulatory protein PII
MKAVFIVYHDILEDRVEKALNSLEIDYYTEWEGVKGKGHKTDAHLGNRPFPGFNCVRMIAIEQDEVIERLISKVTELNEMVERPDDHIRLFQVPLEKII